MAKKIYSSAAKRRFSTMRDCFWAYLKMRKFRDDSRFQGSPYSKDTRETSNAMKHVFLTFFSRKPVGICNWEPLFPKISKVLIYLILSFFTTFNYTIARLRKVIMWARSQLKNKEGQSTSKHSLLRCWDCVLLFGRCINENGKKIIQMLQKEQNFKNIRDFKSINTPHHSQ